MMEMFLECFCSSLIILISMCLLRDIKIKLKMLIWLFAIYALISPSILITEPNNNFIGRAFQIIYLICPLITTLIAFRLQKIKSILYTYLIYTGSMYYISFLIVAVLSFFSIDEIISSIIDVNIYLMVLILIMFIYLKRYKYANLKNLTLISTKLKILALVSFWVSGFYCSFLRRMIEPMGHNKTTIAIFIFSIIVITLMGIFCPVIIAYGSAKERYRLLSKSYADQAKAQVNRYKQMQEANEDLRKFRHDYGNFHKGLKTLLKENKVDKAIEKINSFDGTVDFESRGMYNTNNYIVDGLLQEKQHLAAKFNTIIKFDGIVPPDYIDMEDLCIMFGVPLDNAIEACEKLSKDKEKIITVTSEPIKSCLFIIIKNPVADNFIIENNHIETTKGDNKNHGIGLYSLRKSLEKYDGNVEISCKDNIFKIKLSLLYR